MQMHERGGGRVVGLIRCCGVAPRVLQRLSGGEGARRSKRGQRRQRRRRGAKANLQGRETTLIAAMQQIIARLDCMV